MSDPIRVDPLLRMMASKPAWSVFLPGDGDGPSIDAKAGWLSDFLGSWSGLVDRFVGSIAEEDGSTRDGQDAPDDDLGQAMRLSLESLVNASDAMLAFRRLDYPIEFPEAFPKAANALFAEAERRGIQAEGQTIPQVARRLAAATSHRTARFRPTRVDDRGRVFERLSGARLFQFEPEKILKGRRQAKASLTHSLDAIREAEGRNGA